MTLEARAQPAENRRPVRRSSPDDHRGEIVRCRQAGDTAPEHDDRSGLAHRFCPMVQKTAFRATTIVCPTPVVKRQTGEADTVNYLRQQRAERAEVQLGAFAT